MQEQQDAAGKLECECGGIEFVLQVTNALQTKVDDLVVLALAAGADPAAVEAIKHRQWTNMAPTSSEGAASVLSLYACLCVIWMVDRSSFSRFVMIVMQIWWR